MNRDSARARAGGPALEKCYQFLVWLLPTLEKFPRSQRFLLGDRIERTALDVLEGLVEATYSAQCEPLLLRTPEPPRSGGKRPWKTAWRKVGNASGR